MYSHISQLLLLYKMWRYYNKFDSTKSLGVYYWCVKIPQCKYMENGLKYITFYVQKHIVHLVMYYDTLLVHDKPLGAPTLVKLLNCDCICVLKNTVVESVQRICSSIKWHWSHGQLMTAGPHVVPATPSFRINPPNLFLHYLGMITVFWIPPTLKSHWNWYTYRAPIQVSTVKCYEICWTGDDQVQCSYINQLSSPWEKSCFVDDLLKWSFVDDLFQYFSSNFTEVCS